MLSRKGRDSMSSDGSLKFDTKILTDGFNSGINKLGSIAKGGLAVIGGAIGGAVVGFGALTKSALDSVSSLEQNVGGVETLFKNSADAVIANANRAYQTAGMSANDYMSTVTSFSASLLQSLSGNTEEAAKVADMAITDMSDNANKMGTSMELIQNAYQGFAKQNYTMLDNLKLGYGGTKTEMERLLKDAQKISGVKYDISNLNDVYEAIHVIQGELGITGTTAKEAASTIEGSMNSAKAAWDNFLAGSGSVDELVDAATTAGTVVLKNLGEIVPRLLETVPAFVKAFCEAFTTPDVLNTGSELVQSLIAGFSDVLPMVGEAGVNILNTLLSGLATSGVFLNQGIDYLVELMEGISAQMPALAEKGGEAIATLLRVLTNRAPDLLTAGVGILLSLVDGISSQLPTLIPLALQAILSFVSGIISNLPQIVETGLNLLSGLVDGILEAIPILIDSAPVIIGDLASAIVSYMPTIIQTGVTLIGKLALGLIKAIPQLISKIPSIISAIRSTFTSVDWGDVGINIIKGIAGGISGAVGELIEAAANAAEDALEWVKKKLGIHSPSRVFRDEVGKMMALGIGEGFEKNIPTDDIGKSIDGVIAKATKKVTKVTTSNPSGVKSVVRNTTNNYTDAQVDYRKIKEAQKEAMNEANERPIVLNEREINRATKK